MALADWTKTDTAAALGVANGRLIASQGTATAGDPALAKGPYTYAAGLQLDVEITPANLLSKFWLGWNSTNAPGTHTHANAKYAWYVEGDRLYGIPLEPWTNVIKAGSDFEVGEKILTKGTIIAPSMIGLLHAAGIGSVEVYGKPRVAIISTGDEIRNGMTKNTNAPTAAAMLKSWGCEPESIGTVRDAFEDTAAALDDASSRYDLILTIGGVSVGKKDFVVKAITEAGNVVFRGYRIRPGKPLLVSYYKDKPVFSLPGKPTGAYTAMELIVRRFLLGETRRAAVSLPVSRDVDIPTDGFDYIVYVKIIGEKAVPVGYQDSPLKLFSGSKYGVSIVSSSPRSMIADGFIMAHGSLKAGAAVNVQLL
jgi:molybdenum cofactor synthesis domain-containing protein